MTWVGLDEGVYDLGVAGLGGAGQLGLVIPYTVQPPTFRMILALGATNRWTGIIPASNTYYN
jgi:hypothetical protein